MSKKIIISLVVGALLIGGYFYYRSRDTGPVTPTETVKRGTVSLVVSVTGDLVPEEYADLSFSGIGVVDHVFFKKGDSVKKGDIVASLDRSVLQSRLNEARVAVAIAEENEKLARRGWEDLKPEERSAKKLTTKQARESVRTIVAQMDESTLVAPMDGVLSKIDIREGETMTATTLAARVVRDAALIVKARVPESDIISVHPGMKADITFDALTLDDIFSAEVISIDPAATVIQDVVSYDVKFRMIDFDQRLKEGMTANIDIKVAEADNVLTLPFRSLSKVGNKTYADLQHPDGTSTRVEVTVGIEGDDGTIEIKSGLKEGDQVAIIGRQQ